MKFESILNLIRKPKASAAELRDALAALDIKAAEGAVDALEAQRHALLLKTGADAEIEDIETRIRVGNREVERLHAGKVELSKLLAEAEAREHAAEIETRAAAAREAQVEGLRLYVAIDEAAAGLCNLLDRLDKVSGEIRAANRYLAEHGRSDLKTPAPEVALAQHIGVTSSASLPNPQHWALDGYRARNLDGLLVAPGKHRLSRAAELLPEGQRKAA
jgi:hypothetical protein